MADPRKPGKRETDALKMAGEIRLREIAARRLKLEKQYQRLQQGEIKNAKELEKLHKEALHLSNLEVESRGKLSKIQDTIVSQFKSDTYDRIVGFLKKEVSVAHQLDFVWERIRHGAELYGKMQGSLPALTGKQLSEIEKLNKKIAEGGISAKTAFDIFESMPEVFKDISKAAGVIAKQQFLMAEAARSTALRYGKTYEEVRNLQKTVQQTLAIRVVDKGTRKDIEQVTDSLLYMEDRGIMPVADALKYTTKLSRQFGYGTTAAVEDSAKVFEKLARIPDYLSDRMKKTEGVVGRFAATNREDFLNTVLELNEAYGTQSTILSNVGATFAHLTLEARKYGAEAQTASNVSKALSSSLLDNTKDTHITFLAGQKLAEELQSQPGAFEEMTAGMTDEMKKNIQRMVEEGGIAYSDLANALASTSKGMEARLGVIRNIYSGRGLGVISRLLPSIPGLENLKGPEEKYTAARMLTEGASAKEIIAAVNNLQKTSEKGNNERRKADVKTLEAAHTTAEPIRAVATRWKAAKEVGFRETMGAIGGGEGGEDEKTLLDKILGLTDAFGGLEASMLGVGTAAAAANIGLTAVGLASKGVKGVGGVLAKSSGLVTTMLTSMGIGGAAIGGAALLGVGGGYLIYENLKEENEKAQERMKEQIKQNKEWAKTATEEEKESGRIARTQATARLATKLTPEQRVMWEKQKAIKQGLFTNLTPEQRDTWEQQQKAKIGLLEKLTPEQRARWEQQQLFMAETTEKPFKNFTNINAQVTSGSTIPDEFLKQSNTGSSAPLNTGSSAQVGITATKSNGIKLNPDGSATIKTILELDQNVPGFSSAAVGAVENAKANRRYGS